MAINLVSYRLPPTRRLKDESLLAHADSSKHRLYAHDIDDAEAAPFQWMRATGPDVVVYVDPTERWPAVADIKWLKRDWHVYGRRHDLESWGSWCSGDPSPLYLIDPSPDDLRAYVIGSSVLQSGFVLPSFVPAVHAHLAALHSAGGGATSDGPDFVAPYEERYRVLLRGVGKGAAARRKSIQWWADRGADGARWLATRLRDETDVEAHAAVADVLAGIGRGAGSAILRVLEGDTNEMQAETLLRAVSWLDLHSAPIGAATRALSRYFQHVSPDVRIAACLAASSLPAEASLPTLKRMLRIEQDPEVREGAQAAVSRIEGATAA